MNGLTGPGGCGPTFIMVKVELWSTASGEEQNSFVLQLYTLYLHHDDDYNINIIFYLL